MVSRGRTTIEKGLNMIVSTIPWGDVNDLAATAVALDHMADALTTVPGLTYLYGPKASTNYSQSAANLTGAEFLASVGNASLHTEQYLIGNSRFP
jgi:cellobiose dehydrogenase (acceptor)